MPCEIIGLWPSAKLNPRKIFKIFDIHKLDLNFLGFEVLKSGGEGGIEYDLESYSNRNKKVQFDLGAS